MGAEFDKLREVFLEAVEQHAPEAWPEFLDRACGGDAALRAEVEELLRSHARGEREAPLSPPDWQGRSIGPYRLVGLIGEGGMGAVYMAEQAEPIQRRVAIKIIKAGLDSRQVIARFETERQLLALMDHPNIARVLDAGATPSGEPYFVMELIKGIPITKFCDERHLTPRERLALFIPVCRAIQHAHQKGIIHRDLKPSNVMIALYDGRPVPKVIDFGVAKAVSQPLSELRATTGFGAIIGTLEYMSPEQAELNQLDVDARSDIYGLGVLLYELLTGTTPLQRDRVRAAANLEVLRLIREESPPPPSTRLSTTEELPSIAANRGVEPGKLSGVVRGELDWIVMRCLEKDRARRYSSADGLARELERFLADEPVEACPPSTWYRLEKLARRHRVGLATVAAFLVLLVAGTATATWLAVRAMKAETAAREQAAVAESILAFVQDDLLGGAGPGRSDDRDLKLRTVLDRAAQRAAIAFKDRPLVEAGLAHTMGIAYLTLGDYATAERLLARAVELSGRLRGPRARETLIARRDLAVLWFRQGRLDDARRTQEEILSAMRVSLGPGDIETFKCVGNLVNVLNAQGHAQEAGRLLEDELPALRRALGADHDMTLNAMLRLGSVYSAEGRPDQAREIDEEVLAIARRKLGTGHPITVIAMNNLASALTRLGRKDEARALYVEALEIKRRTLGPEHPSTLIAIYNLADLDVSMGRLAEAQAGFEQALAGQRKLLGVDHTETTRSMLGLGRVLYQRGDDKAARAILEETFAAQSRALGVDHPDALITLNLLGDIALQERRYKDAREAYERVLSGRRRVLGTGHPETLRFTNAFAWVLVANAAPEFRDPTRAVALAKDVLAQTPDSGGVWNTLGVAEYRSGHWTQAVDALTKSMRLRGGGDANDFFFMAMTELRLGHVAEAKAWYRKGVDDMAKRGSRDLALTRFRSEAERLLRPVST